MFYSQNFLSKHGPLGTIWIAAYCFKKLKKSQVKDIDISSSVDKILQDEFDAVTYRILAYLLLGVVRIYSKKVEYLYDDCNRVLLKIKDYMVKFKDRTIMETLQAPYFSITLPERFELDAFDLEILEDTTGHNVVPHEEITLKEGIWKSGKTGQCSVDKYKDSAACHDNIPGEDFLSSHHMDFEMEVGTMCDKYNLQANVECQDAEMASVVEEVPPNPESLSIDNHQAEREHISITETISLDKVHVKASRQVLIDSSLYQEANVSFKTIGRIEEHNRLDEHDMDIQDVEFHGDAREHFDLSDVDAIIEKLRCGSFSQEMQIDTKFFCTVEETSANVGSLGEEQQCNAKHSYISEINLSENVENALVAEDQPPPNIFDATPQSMCRDTEVFCAVEETSANFGPLGEEQQNIAEHNKISELSLSENVKSAIITEDQPPPKMIDATPPSKFQDVGVFCTVEETSANVGPLGEDQQSTAEHNKISEMNQSENIKRVGVTKDQPPSKILDATPQSKFREISVIHTPTVNECSQMKRKRNCCWDDVTVLHNDFIKKCINDYSSLVSKRRKVPFNALAAWRTHQVSNLPHCFQKPLISCASLELSSFFSCKKVKIPVLIETAEVSQVILSDSPANDRLDELVDILENKAISQLSSAGEAVGNAEPVQNLTVEASLDIHSEFPSVNGRSSELVATSEKTISQLGSAGHAVANMESLENPDVSELRPVDRPVEPGEPSAELGVPAPETPIRQTIALRPFDSPERSEICNSDGIRLASEIVKEGLAWPCNDQDFDFSLIMINKEMNLCEGDKYEDHYGWSERTRLVANYLLTGFLNQRKQGEDEILNLSQLLDGRTKRESARIFYEVLVLKSKGFVLVKQENAYTDILVSKSLQWDQVFGTKSS